MSLIAGEGSLLGFHGPFDSDFGDPSSPTPYPRVTPSRVGPVLLPFPCPRCMRPAPELVTELAKWSDPRRGFAWCPRCRVRMVVDAKGAPLATSLPAGALVAPARVERGGEAELLELEQGGGLDLVGS